MQRLQAFDALRAVAVLLVVFYHQTEIGGAPFGSLLTLGWIGVDLFFVLSGFFIGLSILNMKKWSFRHFIIRRSKRIIPAYYFSMLMIIALGGGYFLVTINGWVHLLSHLSFLHPYSYSTHGSINGAYWSLGVEFAFYLAIGSSALLIRHRRRFWFVVASWVLIAWTWRAGIYFFLDVEPIFKFIWATQLPGMLDEFALGLVVARLSIDGTIKSLVRNKILVAIIGVVSAVCIGLFMYRLNTVPFWADLYSMVFSRTELAIGFASLFCVFLSLENNRFLHAVTKYSGLQYLGRISYSIYLFHMPVLINIKGSLSTSDLNLYWVGVLSLGAVVLVSAVSYHFIEERFFHQHKVSDIH